VRVCSGDGGGGGAEARGVLVAAYSREALGQTGALGRATVGLHSGHYSPLGGYHEPTDSVLIMDVARFKYPPHWVPLRELFRAMRYPDAETGLSRGYMVVSPTSPLSLALRAAVGGRSILDSVFGNPSSERAEAAREEARRNMAVQRRCGGQGRLVGAARATLRRLFPAAQLGSTAASAVGLDSVEGWVRELRASWEREEALHSEAEVPHPAQGGHQGEGEEEEFEGALHQHPAWGGEPLSPNQATAAAAFLRGLEALPLFFRVRECIRVVPWELSPPAAAAPGGGFAVTPAHRLTLLLALGILEKGGGHGHHPLLAGLPASVRDELVAQASNSLPCKRCFT
jgi:hypothetical protein